MLKIQTPRSFKTAIFMSLGIVVVLAGLLVSLSLFKAQALDPVTITVNTLIDEDGTGANCSLREAAQAARTAAAYAGCSAGTGSGDTINLSIAGTYAFNDSSNPQIELENTSVIGLTSATSIVSGYNFHVTGNLAATVRNVTLTETSLVLIGGSHKTFDSIILKDAAISEFIIEDDSAVTDLTLTGVTTSNLGGFQISCDDNTICSDIALRNSTITTNLDRIYIGSGAQSDISNTTLTSVDSINYYVGADAVIDNVTMNSVETMYVDTESDSSIDGLTQISEDGAWIIVDDRSIINDVSQTSTADADGIVNISGYNGVDPLVSVTNITQTVNYGGTITLQVDTPLIENVEMHAHAIAYDNSSSAAIYNETPGSTLRHINMIGDDAGINTNAVLIDDVTISKGGSADSGDLNFSNENDDAVIQHLTVEDMGAYLSLDGDDGVLQDSTIGMLTSLSVEGDNFSLLRSQISGNGGSNFATTGLVLIEDMTFTAVSNIYGSMEDLTLRDSSFSLSGGPLSGSYSGDVLIDNVLFDTNSGAISLGASSADATLEIRNTDILDSYTTVTSGSPCVVGASGFDTVLIDTVTVDGSNNGCGGIITPSNINTLTVRNTSITNNNAPAFYGSSLNADIIFDNVTFDNNTGGLFLMGSDSTKSFTATNITMTDNFTQFHGNGPPAGFEVTSYANVSIDGFEARGNLTPGASGSGILYISAGTHHTLNNIQINGSGNGADGIVISAPSATIDVSDALVEGVVGTGIGLLGKIIAVESLTVNDADSYAAEISAVTSASEFSLLDSTFNGNGRGVNIYSEGVASLNNVAIADTATAYGLRVSRHEAHIANVTVSGGQSTSSPAVVLLQGAYDIDNMTVTDNAGGGVAVGSPTTVTNATIKNSTIARNAMGAFDPDTDQKSAGLASIGSPDDEDFTSVVAVKNSLIFANTGSAQCIEYDKATIAATFSIVSDNSCSGAQTVSDIDTFVAANLADNNSDGDGLGYHQTGGPLQTLSLINTPNNPAIGAGDPASCSTYDARGFERDLTKGCDIGSFQVNIAGAGSTDPGTPSTGGGTSGGSGSGGTSGSGSGDGSVTAPNTGELATIQPSTNNGNATDESSDGDEDASSSSFNGTTVLIIVIITIIAGVGVTGLVIRARRNTP